MGKAKKIIAGVLVVAVAGTGIGAGLMQLRKNSQKEVEVTPVSGLLQEYYQQSTNLDGQIASSATQTVTGDKDLVVDQVFVSKGDNVKKDDPLISFDTTLVEMELNIAKLKKQKQEQDLTKAANRLNSLLNGGPVQESDSGTDADNTLNTTTGSDSEGDDDMTPDSAMSSAADFSGNYLAAAIHPYLLHLQMGHQMIQKQIHPVRLHPEQMQIIQEIRMIHLQIQMEAVSVRHRPIQIRQPVNLETDRTTIPLIQEIIMIHRSCHLHLHQYWMIIPAVSIPTIRREIRISQMAMNHSIRN